MVRFETEVSRNVFGRPRLVINSTHEVHNGFLQNMFEQRHGGRPMLDVADAIELRAILDKFIKGEA